MLLQIQLKKILDIGMAIIGFCLHLDPLQNFFWDCDISYPSLKVTTSLYSRVGDDFQLRKVVPPLY
jgi:hypothetical protein